VKQLRERKGSEKESPEFQILHGTCGSQWFLWIVQDMSHGIHSNLR
jgi:hypothetical protein